MKKFINKVSKFGIRKFSVGVSSCMIGCFVLFAIENINTASATEVVETETVARYDNGTEKNKKTNIENDITEIATTLSEKNYDHQDIINKYGEGRVSTVEKTPKTIEIMKRDNVDYNTASSRAESEIRRERGERLDFKDSYNKVHNNINEEVKSILENSTSEVAENKNKIQNNSTNFMIGLTYLERLYNFKVGENTTAKDILSKHIDYFKQNSGSNVDLILEIGRQATDNLSLKNTERLYSTVISKYTGKRSLTDFIESFVPENKSADDWYKETSKAYIVETSSKEAPNMDYKLYGKLKSNNSLKKYILPLLNVSKESIYAISNPTTVTLGMYDTYVNSGEEDIFKEKLNEAATRQIDFINFWLRIAKEEDKNKLSSARLVIDTMMKKSNNPNEEARNRWSPRIGNGVAKGVKEFFGPLEQYSSYIYIGGQAEGNGMRLFVTSALDDDGLSTYTHELTHLLDKTVWFNNNGRRDGLKVEFFARGLFESYETNDPIYNLNLIYNKKENRYTNKNAERFSNENDLKEYMRGVMDTTYLLDGLEAEEILKRDTAIKKKWFNKLEQVIDNSRITNNGEHNYTHTNDSFSNIDDVIANKLNTLEDLIDNNIIASRYEFKGRQSVGESQANGYYVIPLFTPNYATAENENGVSGDIITRKLAYEILAEYGYSDGLVPYLSNKYKTSATEKITDKIIFDRMLQGKTIKDFKKEMFRERLAKEIKPVTINVDGKEIQISSKEKLKELIKEAIDKDLLMERTTSTSNGAVINNGPLPKDTNLEKLKAAFYRAVINDTNDFKTSIFKNQNAGDITVKYVDESNAKLKEDLVVSGENKLGENYTPENIEIENFELSTPLSAISFTENPQDLILRYTRKNAGNITINHKDALTGNILGTETIDGTKKHGISLTVSADSFENYELEEAPENELITFGENPQVINYTYKRKDAGSITIKYVNEEGTEISTPTIITGNNKLGLTENITPKTIKNFKIKENSNTPTNLTFTENEQTITIVYNYTKEIPESTTKDINISATSTRYEADENQPRGYREEISGAGLSRETTTYSLDKNTGEIIENKKVEILIPAKENVIKIGTKPTYSESTEHPIIEEVRTLDTEWEDYENVVEGFHKITRNKTEYTLNTETGEITENTTEEIINEGSPKIITRGKKKIIGYITETTTREIEYSTENKEDAAKIISYKNIVNGITGLETIYTEYKTEKGNKTNEVVSTRIEITRQKQNKIITVGTKPITIKIIDKDNNLVETVKITSLDDIETTKLRLKEKYKTLSALFDRDFNEEIIEIRENPFIYKILEVNLYAEDLPILSAEEIEKLKKEIKTEALPRIDNIYFDKGKSLMTEKPIFDISKLKKLPNTGIKEENTAIATLGLISIYLILARRKFKK